MNPSIQMHVAKLSLSNIIFYLDNLAIHRSQRAVNDRVQKADQQLDGGADQNQVALDGSMSRINDQQY